MTTVDEKCKHHCNNATKEFNTACNSPEKQSMREAMVHLLARYLEMRPLFLAAARPMNVEWKIRPYLGVFPLVFNALFDNKNKVKTRNP